MRRIVLFSVLTPNNKDEILKLVFPEEISTKILAYMPSDGENIKQKYVDEWKEYARAHKVSFNLVNNLSEKPKDEATKILNSNILLMTGGNTFKLLHNLRQSGLDKTIQEFVKKDEFVLTGFSAGAIVLTPTIEICNLPNYDENLVNITDFTGLGIINFEVFPHYDEATQKQILENYKRTANNEVKEIADDGVIVIDL